MKKVTPIPIKRVLSSIIYIQAAVLQATGIRVKPDELMNILLDEKLITRSMVRGLQTPDLNRFGALPSTTEKIYA